MNVNKGQLKVLILITVLICFCTQGVSQTPIPFSGNINWLSGYQKEVSGETLTYFSAFPDYINQALLTRCTNGTKEIEWLTAPVPASPKAEYAYFRWVAAHSTGTSSGLRHFDFYINNEKVITFTTQPGNKTPVWSFAGSDSTRLIFIQSKTDAANDAHGIAYLRVPYSLITPGQPLRLKVIGQAQQSNDWYMTFKYAFEERADISSLPFLLKNGKQPILLNVLHFGKKERLNVLVNKKEKFLFDLDEGMNKFEIPITATKQKDSIHVLVKYGTTVLSNSYLVIEPVMQREIHFIHHSHTDIGYSHLQPDVERIHTKNIKDALRLIEKTKNYPAEATFKWNVESLWAVENFLKQASPEEKGKFIAAVKSGSICLSALYANILTGLSMPEELFHYTDYAELLRRQYQLPIESAMISDVPGLTWSVVTALAKGGVRYLSSGPNYLGKNNPYLGDRVGHFVKTWGDNPVWWQSPSGAEKILLWAGGRGYSSWHGNAPGAIFSTGTKKIAEYLNDLAVNNYPYEIVQWRYNCVADNAPLDSTISNFVKQWNEKYATPKIILNTTDKLFKRFESRYGKQLPVVKGDITPYWEDGAASTAYEEGLNRANSLRLQQLTTLYAILSPQKYSSSYFYEAWRNIILFHEHTWGAHNSISQPDIPFVTEQWRIKKDFMLEADKRIHSLTDKLLGPVIDLSSKKIGVINTLSWQRTGPVFLPSTINASAVRDGKGNVYALQELSDGRKVFLAENIRPLGVTYFYIQSHKNQDSNKIPFTITDSTIYNGKISIGWSKQNGSITKFEKSGYDFSGRFKNQGLNGYWYVPGLSPDGAETNGEVSTSIEEQGPSLVTVSLRSSAPGAQKLVRKITLYANDEKVHLENIIDKKSVRTKEAVYFSFPFISSLNKTTLDAGYGTIEYLRDQLPGSNMDYLSTRRWLDVSDNNSGVQIMMIEPFMASPGAMVDESLVINQSHKRWREEGTPTATWFSYIMNNYWHTNYKADQDSISHYHFALKPHGPLQNTEQEKSAMEFTQPLMAFLVRENAEMTQNLFALTNNNVVVTSITPHLDQGFMIRLFNPEATKQTTTFIWNQLQPTSMVDRSSKKEFGVNHEINITGYGIIELLVK